MVIAIIIVLLLVVAFILYKSGVFSKLEKAPSEKVPKKTIDIDNSIRMFDIQIEADNVEIKETGEEYKIVTTNPNLEVAESGETLCISSQGDVTELSKTVIYVPGIKKLDSISCKINKGDLYITNVMVKEVNIKLESGNLMLDKTMISETGSYEVPAGNITMGDGTYYNSKIEIGTGNFKATAKLCGTSNINCENGDISYKSQRELKAYTIRCKTDDGRIGCDGLKGDKIVYGKGSDLIECYTKHGNITINYFE